MTAEKTPNYTPEMTATMVADYTADPSESTVKALAERFGKSARSIVAKLAREGVYVSKGKETAGKRAMLKAEMVAKLATLTGKSEEALGSLEKATGPALVALIVALEAKTETEEDGAD